MYNVTSEKELITIGEAGENIAESCTIDFNDWIQKYGQGDLRIRAIRAGDKQPYPVSNVTVSDGVATWTYTEADTAIKGYGEVQILYYVGDVLSKSRVWQTYTHRSLSVPGEPPQPYDDWIRQVEESADEARGYAASALESANTAGEYKRGAEAAQEAAEIAQELTDQIKEEAKTAKIAAENARNAAQGYATAAAQSATQAEETAESIEASADTIQKLLANQIHDTATGTIASFPDGADMPMVSLVADIDPIQDTSGGAPSPSNICPISGWDSVDVSVAGKNLFNVSMDSTQVDPTRKYTLHLKPNTQYTMSTDVPYTSPASVYFNGGSSGTNGVGLNRPKTFTSDANGMLTVDIRTRAVDQSINAYDALLNGVYWIQLEEGDTATTYEAYTETTHTTDLPQTVYGGTLDVVSGVLTVDRAMVDLGTLNWTRSTTAQSGKYRFSASPISGIKKAADFVSQAHAISSQYATASWVDTYNCVDETLGSSPTTETIAIFDSNYETATVGEFKTAMNGVQLVYELATPTTIQLTPTQIQTLQGQNNVWADSGDVTVEYIADTKLYIQKVIG